MTPKTKELLNRSPTKSQEKTEPFVLTDAQWQQISDASGLPAKARGALQKHIRFYRDSLSCHPPTPSEMRDELLDCAKKLSSAMELFKRDSLSVKLYLHHHDNWPPDRINRFVIEAAGFVKLLGKAASHVPRGQRGPDNWQLYSLVGGLADVLDRYGGQELSLSKKLYGPAKRWNAAKYIYLTCKIVAPRSGENTIRHAIVEVTKAIKEAQSEKKGKL